ncbi:1_t:CDS:2 [Paraglomus brasilianum]|uniref:1_t:CDS:1 n=1 Tax=Paraglomus brasilianum TaxID=144538 RepID=A0A9N9CYF6_9GLOM|nr:1_t:CDS:2 [Paraglomus brasilianum]
MDTHSGSLFPGSARKRKLNDSHSPQNTEDADDSWVDVYKNIKRMDTLYDATFYNWLKSEDNVVVISMYLHRIANQYPLPRIINALKWLISDWRLESIAVLVKQVTVDWKGNEGDSRRGTLLRHMTYNWAPQFTASLIASILTAPPYTTSTSYVASITTINAARQRFLKALTSDYDFSKLSEFLMCLGSQLSLSSSSSSSVVGCVRSSNGDGIIVGGTVASSSTFSFSSSSTLTSNQSIQHEHIETIELEHKIKVALLKDAARREREKEAELEEKIARRCREWRERGSDREGGEAKRLKLSDESENTRARVLERIGNNNGDETSASIISTLSIRTREQLVSDAGHSEDGLILGESGEGVAVVIGSSNSHGHGHTFGGQASHDCQSIETAVPSQEGLTKSVPSNDGSISGNEMIL